MDRDIKFAYIQFIRSANRKIRSSLTFIILVKIVIIVVTTPVSYSTICVYTSVVLVNMLQVYTLWCYYWSWYLARQGHQQIWSLIWQVIHSPPRVEYRVDEGGALRCVCGRRQPGQLRLERCWGWLFHHMRGSEFQSPTVRTSKEWRNARVEEPTARNLN